MDTDWRLYVPDFKVEDEWLYIPLEGVRGHWVLVRPHDDGWELSGGSATAQELAAADLDTAELWRRNRSMNLVAYAVDDEGTAWVTAWLPYPGVTAEEFQEVARQVAIEADRLEFHCTGRDEN